MGIKGKTTFELTDVNTGEVLALVSYPGYDINKLANGVDSAYYAKIQADLSLPQLIAQSFKRESLLIKSSASMGI